MELRRVEKKDRKTKSKDDEWVDEDMPGDEAMEGVVEEEMDEYSELPDPSLALVRSAAAPAAEDDELDLVT